MGDSSSLLSQVSACLMNRGNDYLLLDFSSILIVSILIGVSLWNKGPVGLLLIIKALSFLSLGFLLCDATDHVYRCHFVLFASSGEIGTQGMDTRESDTMATI